MAMKIRSIEYPELETILCDVCYGEATELQYDDKVQVSYSFRDDDCDTCTNNITNEENLN